MNPVPTSCLDRLSANDLQFICSVLASGEAELRAVARLAVDRESLAELLADRALLKAVLRRGDLAEISPELYFYVLVRHALPLAGVADREIADYVAATLAEYARCNPLDPREGPDAGNARDFTYHLDLIEALESAGGYERFYLHVHSGNQFLVLTGLFPRFLRGREARRGAPGLEYYEEVAGMAFRSASRHPLADEFSVRRVYGLLSEQIRATRFGLNRLADEFLVLAN